MVRCLFIRCGPESALKLLKHDSQEKEIITGNLRVAP